MHPSWMRTILPLLIVLCSTGVGIHASSGDRNPGFQRCLSYKMSQQCRNEEFYEDLPLSLRLTQWSCEDDCKYQCSHIMTDKAEKEQRRIEQYYGKWAFWRLLGVQEPASVLFSLINLCAHIRWGIKLRRGISNTHPMRPYYLGFTISNLNLWIWSAVFHIRGELHVPSWSNISLPFMLDKQITERLDYFSAAFAMLCGLFYSVVRLYHLYDSPRTSSRNAWLIPWASLCVLLFTAHVAYLTSLPRFDYGWNMKVNIAIGLTYNLLWISYALPYPPYTRFLSKPNSYRPPFVLSPLFLGLAMIGAVCLEIFDFPPWWRVIDAHSLWHLATVPIVIFWYRFLLLDALDPAWMEEKKIP